MVGRVKFQVKTKHGTWRTCYVKVGRVAHNFALLTGYGIKCRYTQQVRMMAA